MKTENKRPASRRDVWLAAGTAAALLGGGMLARDEINRRTRVREARAEWLQAFAQAAGARRVYERLGKDGPEQREAEGKLLEKMTEARRKAEANGGTVGVNF